MLWDSWLEGGVLSRWSRGRLGSPTFERIQLRVDKVFRFGKRRGDSSVVQDIQSHFDDLTMLDELIGQMDDIALGTGLGTRYHRVEY